MLKYYCDVCGAEVKRAGTLTTLYSEVGFGSLGASDPRVSVQIRVEQSGGLPDDRSHATCSDCIRDAVIVALGLPTSLLNGPAHRTDPKGI
jgi:hypothetical protein